MQIVKISKKTWAGIKELITLKPNGFNAPSKIVVGNNVITDSKAIASAFNKYFSDIGRKLAEEIPQVGIDPLDFLGPSQANSFMLFPVSAVEIENEITRLNSSKASGPLSIPVCLLKLLKTCISFPLEFIFNLSFSSGCVPDQFKLADVIPVHKKDSVTCMNNYRPISLLSIFNKILEKLVYKRLLLTNIIFYMTNNLALGEIIPLYMQLSLLQTKFKEQLKMAYFRVVFFLIFLKPLILLTIAYY